MNGNDLIEFEEKSNGFLQEKFLKEKGISDYKNIDNSLFETAEYWEFVKQEIDEQQELKADLIKKYGDE